jgi:hypothetical protein
MNGAAFDFLVHNHAVKPFARRIGQQFFGQGDVLLAGKTESEKNAARLGFAFLDALANLDFLLAGQQRDFAHLAQIHLHRVVQNIQAAFFFLFHRFGCGFGRSRSGASTISTSKPRSLE